VIFFLGLLLGTVAAGFSLLICLKRSVAKRANYRKAAFNAARPAASAAAAAPAAPKPKTSASSAAAARPLEPDMPSSQPISLKKQD
jgi:hypothetical protein